MKKTGRLLRFLILAGSLLLVAAIGLVDYSVRENTSIILFYLIPISISSWFLGIRSGIIISLLSSLSWFTVDLIIPSLPRHYFMVYFNGFMETGFFLLDAVLLALLKRSVDKEKLLARLDDLTGALNRHAFYEAAHMEIERARRYKYPVTIGFIDLDNFKQINDRFGHEKGDQVLRNVARNIKNNTRINDVLARIGGDEFVLLMPRVSADSARNIFTKIRNKIEDFSGNQIFLTASIGAVTFIKMPASVEELLKKTDSAMYSVKRSVKGGVNYEVLNN